MKNLFFISLFTICTTFFAFAQKELWGINSGIDLPLQIGGYYGNISKSDINGENPALIHEFDSIHGYRPKGRLFLASNGKLYGTTALGGNRLQIGFDLYTSIGVVFEYDLILNKYRVVKYFDWNETLPDGELAGGQPQIGLLEPLTGQLYGATGNRIYKYDIGTETVTFYNKLPYINGFFSELMKASDGNLYGTSVDSFCPLLTSTGYKNGCVVKFNMTTNNLSVLHPLNCNTALEGFFPYCQLVEITPGKLLGVTYNGGINQQQFGQPQNTAGILFEYNFLTNTYIKKIDFNGFTIGGIPNNLINGGNGKIYGLCQEGGAPQTCNPVNNFGTLFEYAYLTNTLEIKKYFNQCGNNVQYPISLVRTSTGHFIGSSNYPGTFKWSPNTNVITSTDYNILLPINAQNNSNFIEICRKPSYQEFLTNTYAPEVGSTFTYNIQNTNATTYVWNKGATVLPAQTTGILNLQSVTTSDTGIYTCTMTNECGTTVTANLTINVSNLGTDTIDNYKQQITLYPNPTKGVFNLKFPENRGLKATSYKITNLLGQIMEEKDISKSTKSELTINTASYANGVYQITLVTDKGNWNGKFIKE